MLRKANHPGEAQVIKGQKKILQKRKGLFRGPHEEAEIQHEPLRQGKNLAFSKDTHLEKKRVQLKVTARKIEVGLKQKKKLNERRWRWRLAWWRPTEKKEALRLLKLREESTSASVKLELLVWPPPQ